MPVGFFWVWQDTQSEEIKTERKFKKGKKEREKRLKRKKKRLEKEGK